MLLEWYIFYTFPKAEKVIKQELERRNYDVCLPLQKVIRQWKDRKKIIETPLFPNYIFVKTIKTQIYHIAANPKIIKFVAFEGKPAKLKEADIEFIKSACQCGDVYLSNVKKGDKIRINSGLLRGHEGVLVESDGKKRFGLLLKEISQMIIIDLNKTKFEKLNSVAVLE
jgi:transcription elongation factor/antiterminator RfaH